MSATSIHFRYSVYACVSYIIYVSTVMLLLHLNIFEWSVRYHYIFYMFPVFIINLKYLFVAFHLIFHGGQLCFVSSNELKKF